MRPGPHSARQATEEVPLTPAGPILLYDGECGLCDRTVQHALDRDPGGALRFAALQGETAKPILERHGLLPPVGEGWDSVVWVEDPDTPQERTLVRSDAAVALARYLGGGHRSLARFLALIPRPLRDLGYRTVAKVRHRIFPRPDACKVPARDERARFLA